MRNSFIYKAKLGCECEIVLSTKLNGGANAKQFYLQS